jgi:hypothetical protein
VLGPGSMSGPPSYAGTPSGRTLHPQNAQPRHQTRLYGHFPRRASRNSSAAALVRLSNGTVSQPPRRRYPHTKTPGLPYHLRLHSASTTIPQCQHRLYAYPKMIEAVSATGQGTTHRPGTRHVGQNLVATVTRSREGASMPTSDNTLLGALRTQHSGTDINASHRRPACPINLKRNHPGV